MSTMDLAAKFHQETGMYVKNHPKEYVQWLEGTLSEKLEEQVRVNTLFNEDRSALNDE